jgi:hypothetical protein
LELYALDSFLLFFGFDLAAAKQRFVGQLHLAVAEEIQADFGGEGARFTRIYRADYLVATGTVQV